MISIAGYGEFELDLEGAITAQLPPFLEALTPTPLSKSTVDAIPAEAQGAYLLYYSNVLVYVGKSDAEAGLRWRLQRHYSRIQHRENLKPALTTFKSARIFSFSVIDVETLLIRHFERSLGVRPDWNNSGFGSNDPGRERDTQKSSRFDENFPLDLDVPLVLPKHALSNPCSLLDALYWLRPYLPYTFRFREHSFEIQNSRVNPDELFDDSASIRSILNKVVKLLPSGWQATALKGYVILYKERRVDYKNPLLILNS